MGRINRDGLTTVTVDKIKHAPKHVPKDAKIAVVDKDGNVVKLCHDQKEADRWVQRSN